MRNKWGLILGFCVAVVCIFGIVFVAKISPKRTYIGSDDTVSTEGEGKKIEEERQDVIVGHGEEIERERQKEVVEYSEKGDTESKTLESYEMPTPEDSAVSDRAMPLGGKYDNGESPSESPSVESEVSDRSVPLGNNY